MTFAEFQKRAYAVGCNVRVSGTVFFFSRDGVTVRVKLSDAGEPRFALSHLDKGHDIAFHPCTIGDASKALKLPRQ